MSKKQDIWRVESFRFTGFPTPDFQIKEPNWWYNLIGEQPENRTTQPRKGLFQDVGSYNEGELILKVEPFRIDWVFKSIPKPEEEDMATLGDFKNQLIQFEDLMSKWFKFKEFPKFQRIAFGVVMLLPVQDLHFGYTKLSEFLKSSVIIDKDNSSDFFYQINRPRESKAIQKVRINRLSKWSVKRAKFVGILFNEEQKKTISGEDTFACRLELDINSIPDPSLILKQKDCSQLYNEFLELSKEIAMKGDIK